MSDREYSRDWYARNREAQQAKARTRANRNNAFNLKLRALILSAQPCSDCGEPPDPDTPFEFDHRVGIGARAQRRISDLITKGARHFRMIKEITLCDVVCPTCHKKRTYDRMQWKRKNA